MPTLCQLCMFGSQLVDCFFDWPIGELIYRQIVRLSLPCIRLADWSIESNWRIGQLINYFISYLLPLEGGGLRWG